MTTDRYAQIAAGYAVDPDRGLQTPPPRTLPQDTVTLHAGGADGFVPPKRMDTPEELRQELMHMRERYAPFLRDLAPPVTEQVERFFLRHFYVSLDGSAPQAVELPHFGGPVGRHTAVYRTAFTLPAFSGRTVFLCFQGVDYTAQVYVNGRLAGTHEGFFAPFSFDVTGLARAGDNELCVEVQTEYTMHGIGTPAGKIHGDKIYAATGLGWDDPQVGWHHCPSGIGIYGDVSVEVREDACITDLFPRFQLDRQELWVECYSARHEENRPVSFLVSVYGQNFAETVYEDVPIDPVTCVAAGVGDTLTASGLRAEGKLGAAIPLDLGGGYNRFILPLPPIAAPRLWSPETPYLYQVQVKMVVGGQVVSVKARQCGVRTFTQDLDSEPKGTFYLNGQALRLYGANTMGAEQQDVLRGDFDQLIDDILLAKIAHLNFWRFTQRPVQEAIYDYCDRLGLMNQTDLPLFGTVRINQYAEVVRQAGEMERLVRAHPSCVLVSYINEPFPNASNMPHRMLNREELSGLYTALDTAVHLHNPDRVTKYVDGDYDPPNAKLPDSHCYTLWYNGHGLDMGALHKGEWLPVKPGWRFGCGEFGAEGLDFPEVMRDCYPPAWLSEPFDPANIVCAQTASFHAFFYETPQTMEDWVRESQRHQAFATKVMAGAMRRQPLMNSFAIHLFIDAFPSGWMKSILDCRRRPKPAYFAYREALAPVMCSLRSDRFTFFAGERVCLEGYVCNDTDRPVEEVRFMVRRGGTPVYSGRAACAAGMADRLIAFTVPETTREREAFTVDMAAFSGGELVAAASETYMAFPREDRQPLPLLTYAQYDRQREDWDRRIRAGETVVFAPLAAGDYRLPGKTVRAKDCGMSPVYAVSRDTGHPLVDGFCRNDMRYWYDSALDRLAPLVYATLEGEGITPILTSANKGEGGGWQTVPVCGEWPFGRGRVIVCQIDLTDKERNPCAVRFSNRLAEQTAAGCNSGAELPQAQ